MNNKSNDNVAKQFYSNPKIIFENLQELKLKSCETIKIIKITDALIIIFTLCPEIAKYDLLILNPKCSNYIKIRLIFSFCII